MQLQLLIQEYINYQENRQARRPLTITRYSEYLKKRREYLQQKYCCVSVDMNDLEKIDVSDFALTLKSKKRKNKTINGYLAAIKSFLKRCYKQRNYETIKFDQIEFMKGELYTAEILTQTELEELFSMPAIHERQEIIILRNELYLKMLYSTGLRISELSNLETAQINEQQFSVIGKGGKSRVVFITPEIYDLFVSYCLQKDQTTKYLFVAHKIGGGVKHDRPMYKESLEKIIRKYRGYMATSKKITPHTLRHTFASNLVMKGADILKVQKLLGHQSVKTTEIYLHVHDKELLQTHKLILDTIK